MVSSLLASHSHCKAAGQGLFFFAIAKMKQWLRVSEIDHHSANFCLWTLAKILNSTLDMTFFLFVCLFVYLFIYLFTYLFRFGSYLIQEDIIQGGDVLTVS